MQQELDKIWGGWKIGQLLGEGSFGKVYRIEREDFGHTYEAALKIITIPQNQSEIRSILNDGMDEKSVTMYFRSIVEDIVEEFVLMSKLKGNTNIVSYEDHAVVPHEQGIGWNIYIRMELLTPLFDYIRERKLSIRDVIRLGIDMCNALEVCQKYNIIHRDIKPENIFVSNLGKFKLGDFGIARQLEKTSSGLSKKGTYTYMAPEVYKGENYNSTVDIYSLGVVLYRFLNNNRTPFLPAYPNPIRYSDKERANVLRMSGTPMPNPCNAEGRLAEIVLKACAYHPKDRYESAVEMRKALEAVLYDESEAELIYTEGDSLENISVDYVSSTDEGKKNQEEISELLSNNNGSGNSVQLETEKDSLVKPLKEEESKADQQMKDETEGTFYLFGKPEEFIKREAEEAARKKAEEERRREEEQKRAEENRKAEEERKRTEEARLQEEAQKAEEARLREEARMREEEAHRKAEEKRRAEEARKKAEEEEKIFEETRKKEEEKKRREAEAKKKAQGSFGSKKGIMAVAIVCILVGGSIGGYKLYQKSLERKVPDLVNMTLEEAKKKAAGDDDSLKVKEAGAVYSDQVEAGDIISQNVKAGTILKKGDQIGVVISKGALVEVPDFANREISEAEKIAETAGLKPTVAEKIYSDDVKKDRIISQSLEAGSTVEEHETINFVVSDGIEQVKVPDVEGKSKSKAKAALKKAKLKYSTSSEYSSSVEEGAVISQSIKAGKTVDKNTKVKLVISLGKKPEPKPDPSPSGSGGGSSGSSSRKKKSGSSGKNKSGGSSDNIDSWNLVN